MFPDFTCRAAVSVLLAPLLPVRAATPDPIFAAIATAQRLEAEFVACLVGLDEDDANDVRGADEAADRSSDAIAALYATAPTTDAGLRALILHYADETAAQEPSSIGCTNLAHLARIVRRNAPS